MKKNNKNNQNIQSPRVATNDFEDAALKNYSPIVETEWCGIPVLIKKHLSFVSMLEFVDSVVESCFAEDTGEYLPEIKDFAVRCAILTIYSNFSLPDDLERKYSLVYASDAISFVLDFIDLDQFHQMLTAIDKKIEHRAQSNIEALNKQMNEIAANFNVLEDKLSNIFGAVDGDTISKVAGAIANGSFNEDKLVQAFLGNAPHKDNVIPISSEDK